jgi:uncharacterized protein YfaP (DUF2135 family)
MTTTTARLACDTCGTSDGVARRANTFTQCEPCFQRHYGWDCGQRSAALVALGQAVQAARDYEAPEHVIREAVRLVLAGEWSEDDSDAHRLAAITAFTD